MRFRITFAIALTVCAFSGMQDARAADPIEINAVLSMTGTAAFIGKSDAVTLQAFQNSDQSNRRHRRTASQVHRL